MQRLARISLADPSSPADAPASSRPIEVRLLGAFQLMKRGEPVPLRFGGKTEALLSSLALHHGYTARREALLVALWPGSDSLLAGQSLHSLVHSLRRLLGDAIEGAAPVVHSEGAYRLNVEAGVYVDVGAFEGLVRQGEREARAGDDAAAATRYMQAADVYRGDLCNTLTVQAVIERERLRALFLTVLARLADHEYAVCDYDASLRYALALLAHDPCREDAHRLSMRCYVKRGERAQALRQYRLCEEILRTQFEALPELATRSLFDSIRLDPSSI